MTKQQITSEKKWYVIHTYSGFEEQVAENIMQRIKSLGMEDRIFNAVVPKEKQVEIKNGQRKTVEKRIFPGYVLVEMIVTDDSWYIVRNTPNVTGFVGSGITPIPLSTDELKTIQGKMAKEEPIYEMDFKVGETISIIDGPFKGFGGAISEIDAQKGKIKALVNVFGRETPVELDSLQIKKI